jgi:polyphosphate glucokinase
MRTRSSGSPMTLGLDLGGSGLRSGLVEVTSGRLLTDLRLVCFPTPATPEAVSAAIRELSAVLPDAESAVGLAFPGVIGEGLVRTTTNLDASWKGVNGAALVATATGRRAVILNDADAAGLAEMRFGAGVNVRGTVLLLTFGTGIGSALFVDGRLWPNTELGELNLPGLLEDAETYASARTRSLLQLELPVWCVRVNRLLSEYCRLLNPDLIIIGGGISAQWAEYGALVRCAAPIVPAKLRAAAGVVGAALFAAEHSD